MLQAFCVPVAEIEDADAGSYRLKRSRSHQQEPVEGWVMWTSGIIDIVESCATREALERLQDRQRPLLKAISREQPELYAQLGAAFAKRTAALNGEQCAMSDKTPDGEGYAKSSEALDGEPCASSTKGTARRQTSGLDSKPPGAQRAKSAHPNNGEARAKVARRTATPATHASTGAKADVEASEPA